MDTRIVVAGDSSFCPGVDRAIRITEEALSGKSRPAFSVGPLIHNPEVVSRLEMLGLRVLDPDKQWPDLEGLEVIVRSHGIDVETERRLERKGALLLDATCPNVIKAQEAARELVEAGYRVVVLGSPEHPEVRSIAGRAGGPVVVLQSVEEAGEWASSELKEGDRVGVLCQTTISRNLLESVRELLQGKAGELIVRDTICEAVVRRRKEAVKLAAGVDLMVVVGGYNSSNTAHLAGICRSTGTPTVHVESPDEIEPGLVESAGSIGVIGGASTPDWQIEETVERLKSLIPD